jgi:hypothetical protein
MRKEPFTTAVPKRSSGRAALSSTDATVPPRVMLPSDLSTSLKYLDNADLQKLRAAVTAEIDRRAQQRPQSDVSSAVPLSAAIQNTVSTVDELPEGKANLIRASFSAGLKPAAIARIFHISQTLVSRVIRPTDKPKRIGH